MIVCLCRNVSDRAISAAVEAGAREVAAVARETGAGTCCGSCRPAIAALLAGPAPCSPTPCPGCPAARAREREAA